jgi:glycosyltransferase involved in cell wall biosynthesis
MNKIITGVLCKNEANRWLKDFISYITVLSDEIIILDDNSDDNTIEMFDNLGNLTFANYEIHKMINSTFEKNESILRSELWNRCVKKAMINDWIVIFDCDEIISTVEASLLREILKTTPLNIELFGLRLFDMWSKIHYRSDNLWNAHTRIFPFATRFKIQPYNFNTASLHCGRFPIEVLYKRCGYTENIKVKHLGWSLPHERKLKYERYLRTDPEGIYGNMKQYESILDENPNLILFENSYLEI